MNERCTTSTPHRPHHWIDTDSNGYACDGRQVDVIQAADAFEFIDWCDECEKYECTICCDENADREAELVPHVTKHERPDPER